LEESDLYVKEISVDSGRMLKRLLTAPQGRAHRVRKRSNHVTLIVDSRVKPVVEETTPKPTEKEAAKEPKKVAAKTTTKTSAKKKTKE
jgi:large subunit ribosomal protein L22